MIFRRQSGAGRNGKGQWPFLLLWFVAAILLTPFVSAQVVPPASAPQQSTRPAPTTPMPMAPTAATPPVPAATVAKPSIAGTAAAPTEVASPVLPQMPVEPGAEVDRVVAIVNGDLILDSDVDQERRFAALLPYGEAAGVYPVFDDYSRANPAVAGANPYVGEGSHFNFFFSIGQSF